MKYIIYVTWVLTGIFLGVLVRNGWEPRGKGALDSNTTVTQARSLSLNLTRGNPTGKLYSRLSKLQEMDIECLANRWGEVRHSLSPYRDRLVLNRELLEMSDNPPLLVHLGKLLEDDPRAGQYVRQILKFLFYQKAQKDQNEAMRNVALYRSSDLYHKALEGVLDAWIEKDSTGALDYLETVPDENYRMKLSYAWNRIAQKNPQHALAEATRRNDLSTVDYLQGLMFNRSAQKDIEGTWRRIDQLENEGEKSRMRSEAINAVIEVDQEKALEYTYKLTDLREMQPHLETVFSYWLQMDAERAEKAFLGYLERGEPDQRVVESFGKEMAQATAFSASLLFSDLIPSDKAKGDYLYGLLAEQAAIRPREIAELANTYINDNERLGGVYSQVAAHWVEQDEHGAVAWLAELPLSSVRDRAVEAFSDKLFALDPERAVQWASTITNDIERQRRVRELATQWSAIDPDAAEPWLMENLDHLSETE